MQDVTFIHSLFRSGSTYVYNALKRVNRYHIYHEPMHEVMASLPDSWSEINGSVDNLTSKYRHNFLIGSYFDEFAELLPDIKKTFHPKFSFDYYFMDDGDKDSELNGYIDI